MTFRLDRGPQSSSELPNEELIRKANVAILGKASNLEYPASPDSHLTYTEPLKLPKHIVLQSPIVRLLLLPSS